MLAFADDGRVVTVREGNMMSLSVRNSTVQTLSGEQTSHVS